MNKRLMLVSVLMLSPVAFAQTPAAPAVTDSATQKREQVIDQRAAEQEKRIQDGVKDGSLNAKQAEKLEKKEAKIKKMEAKAEADGKVTEKEFKKIEKAQDRASKKIAHKKHEK